jgi:hypothetical protein
MTSLVVMKPKEIVKSVKYWQDMMHINFVKIENTFSLEENENIAEVETNWEYREANITWYVKNCDIPDEDMHATITHELSHIIVAPMSDFLPSKHKKLEEFVVESISRAIMNIKKS